jgi:hypothetical protein
MVVYLNEVALRLSVGTCQVMRDQLLHLTLMCAWEGTSLRIVPMSGRFQAALCNAATLLTFDAPTPPLAYAETDAATVFHDDPRVVEKYQRKMQRLDKAAFNVEDSQQVLARWTEVHDRKAA